MTQWKLAIALLSATTLLTACGGGGGGSGGGGDDTPPRTTEPTNPGDDTPHTPDMQMGIFSDGPVAGLKYVQGANAGFTGADGSFSYDANSNEPVQFFLGKVFLGQAAGSAIVTPFDLASPSVPANLNTGYNVSRLLVSLDQSTAEGIQLPDDINRAQGAVDFSASTGVFEADEDVTAIVERFSLTNNLAAMTEVRQHLEANEQAQQSINTLTQQLGAITSVNVHWNPNLRGEGVLAEVKGSNGEALYLETSNDIIGGESRHWLSKIFYNDGQGHYVALALNSRGQPNVVNRNGTHYRYISGDTFVERDFASISTYRPTQQAFMVERTGVAPISAGAISPERTALILQTMQSLNSGTLTDDRDFLPLVSAALSITGNVLCAGNEAACAQRGGMMPWLEQAADQSQLYNQIAFAQGHVDPDICTDIALTATSQSTCRNRNTLHELSVFFAEERGDYSGLMLLSSGESFFTIWLNEYPYPEDGLASADDYTNKYGMTTAYLVSTDVYRLDDNRLLVRTGRVRVDPYVNSDYRLSDQGIYRDSVPQWFLNLEDDLVPIANKLIANKVFIVNKVDDPRLLGIEPQGLTPVGVYIDMNNPPFDRVGLTIDESMIQEIQDVITYDVDPHSSMYLQTEATPGSLVFRGFRKVVAHAQIVLQDPATGQGREGWFLGLNYHSSIHMPGCEACSIRFSN